MIGKKGSILQRKDVFQEFIADCAAVGVPHEPVAREIAAALDREKHPSPIRPDLERRWYASLRAGRPDFGVYGENGYLADLWMCWTNYSKRYLYLLTRPSLADNSSILDSLAWVRSVADIGCGFGYTCAALKEMLPAASVFGTNVPGAPQTRIAERVALRRGFTVVGSPEAIGPVDLLFASEYFEHFERPIDHLREVLSALSPKAILVANTFGSPSIGHFPVYLINGRAHDGRATSKAFGAELRGHGYARVAARIWNGRPSYWRRMV